MPSKVSDLRPAAAPLTLGNCRVALERVGYRAVSALMPNGLPFGDGPPTILEEAPPWLVTEHPPAVSCRGPAGQYGATQDLAVLVTSRAYGVLAARIRALLEAPGLLKGPVRNGSDGSELRPLRLTGSAPLAMQSALEGTVTFGSRRNFGGWFADVIPLDGRWENGDLFNVPYSELPGISAEEVRPLLNEIDRLPWLIAEESKPPPAPAKKGWLGRG